MSTFCQKVLLLLIDLRSEVVTRWQVPGVWWQRQPAQHLAHRAGTALLAAAVPVFLQVRSPHADVVSHIGGWFKTVGLANSCQHSE